MEDNGAGRRTLSEKGFVVRRPLLLGLVELGRSATPEGSPFFCCRIRFSLKGSFFFAKEFDKVVMGDEGGGGGGGYDEGGSLR